MPLPMAVSAYFDRLSGPVKEIALELSRVIPSRGPRLIATMAHAAPCWTGHDRVVSVVAHTRHCNLQLWQGAQLESGFYGRIEGSGKALRHVKVRSLDEIDDELLDIIDRAIALDAA
jgi:hypothetical protein